MVFLKPVGSWVTLESNQNNPNRSSLYKWGNRGPERKRVIRVSVGAGADSRTLHSSGKLVFYMSSPVETLGFAWGSALTLVSYSGTS